MNTNHNQKVEIYLDRVQDSENLDDCTCSICQNVYFKPVRCSNCEKHFCESCIDQWLKNHPNSCPFCKNFNKMKASPILVGLLDKLKITCQYKEKGCKEIIAYCLLFKHESSCAFSGKIESQYEKLMRNNGPLNLSVHVASRENALDSSFKGVQANKADLNTTFSHSKSVHIKDDFLEKDALNNTISEYTNKKLTKRSFNDSDEEEKDIQKKGGKFTQNQSKFCSDVKQPANSSKFASNQTGKESNEIACKVVLLGESGVGKTCLLNRYVNNYFRNTLPTPGAGYSCKHVHFPESKINVKFEIWDTAGQEKYRSLTKIFYRDAHCVILMYDITRESSYRELESYWIHQISSRSDDIVMILCGNKQDMVDYKETKDDIIEAFAANYGLIPCYTSAKENTGIQEMFRTIGSKLIEKHYPDLHGSPLKNNETNVRNTIQLNLNEEQNDGPNKRKNCKC